MHRAARSSMLWSGWLHVGDNQQIQLNLHLMFGLTLVGVTCLLGLGCLPMLFPGWTPYVYWLVAGVVAATDGLAGLFHELGHAGVAMARGRPVSRITLYGLAAAVRGSNAPIASLDQALIALAGPLSHLLIASVLWGVWSVMPYDNEPLRAAAGFPAMTNFVAALFNLLPLSALDGGHVARALTAVWPPYRGVGAWLRAL